MSVIEEAESLIAIEPKSVFECDLQNALIGLTKQLKATNKIINAYDIQRITSLPTKEHKLIMRHNINKALKEYEDLK